MPDSVPVRGLAAFVVGTLNIVGGLKGSRGFSLFEFAFFFYGDTVNSVFFGERVVVRGW